MHSHFSCNTKLWIIKLKLAPLSIKLLTLLPKDLQGKPTSSKSNGSCSNTIPLLHKLQHAKIAGAEVLLVLTTQGFVVYPTATPEAVHKMLTCHALWLFFICLTTHISIAQLMGTLWFSQFFSTKSAAWGSGNEKTTAPYYAPVMSLA